MGPMTGGEAVYRTVRELGVDCVFGIVSVHNIPIYDAIAHGGGIRTISVRHELERASRLARAQLRQSANAQIVVPGSHGVAQADAHGDRFDASISRPPSGSVAPDYQQPRRPRRRI